MTVAETYLKPKRPIVNVPVEVVTLKVKSLTMPLGEFGYCRIPVTGSKSSVFVHSDNQY